MEVTTSIHHLMCFCDVKSLTERSAKRSFTMLFEHEKSLFWFHVKQIFIAFFTCDSEFLDRKSDDAFLPMTTRAFLMQNLSV